MSAIISCIMPTRDREWCVPHAIAQFQNQTYWDKELIVLDNGSMSVEYLVPDAPNIHYRRATCRFTGPLRNEAIGHTVGDVIAHWDDDDLHHPEQLSYYMGFMGRSGSQVVGADEVCYHDLRTGENWLQKYELMEHWVHGSTLMYRREVWERMPFHGHRTEDMFWLRDIIELGIIPMAVYPWHMSVNLMHDDNIAPKNTSADWWHRLQRLPEWVQRAEYQPLLEAGRRYARRK